MDKILRYPWLCLTVILLIYALLILSTVTRQGISWDEQIDIAIARAYVQRPGGWVIGLWEDPSQTRLPMFMVALVYQLFHTPDLITGRVMSVLAGALTLAAVFVYGRQRFHLVTGLLACGLLATNPFFLAFARVAFTETDIYLACALAWLLVWTDKLQDQQTIGRAAIVGVVLGLAFSAKATAVAVVPVIWFVLWAPAGRRHEAGQRWMPARELVGAVAWMLGCLGAGVWTVHASTSPGSDSRELWSLYRPVLGGWLLLLAWAYWRRWRRGVPVLLALFIPSLAVWTFFVVPPEHLTNPVILDDLGGRLEHEMAFDPWFVMEAAGLYLVCLLIKPGPLMGGGLLAALIAGLCQWSQRRDMRLPVLVVLGYGGSLLLLPLAQTFYIIPIVPVLTLLLADQYTRLYAQRRKLARGLAVLAVLSTASDLAMCYPDFNLNGYQWLGFRQIAGRPSVGYRSVVQTPSDGVEQAMTWLNEHASPGATVRAYVLAWHIVEAVAPAPQYQIVNGFKDTRLSPDYVVTEINALIPQSWWTRQPAEGFPPPYELAWLEGNYKKVFAVERAFGIEMATVWQKHDPGKANF